MFYLIQITTPWMCAGIICQEDGTIVEAANILKGFINKHFRTLTQYYTKRCSTDFKYQLVCKW